MDDASVFRIMRKHFGQCKGYEGLYWRVDDPLFQRFRRDVSILFRQEIDVRACRRV